jgi:SAM-dependent methyltransferase
MRAQDAFWSRYYADVIRKGDPWLDYSNDRVQAQTFGLALEAAGAVRMKRCLDVGCGLGDFCRALSVLRASSVTGVDIVPEVIEGHRQALPDIEWMCGSLQAPDLDGQLGSYDVAFLLEVLQYAPIAEATRLIWRHVDRGGRIVAVVPNARCPIVSRTRARFESYYTPPTVSDIDAALRQLPDLESAIYRGLFFRGDQQLVPYDVSQWTTTGDWEQEPNRIQFVALKRAASENDGRILPVAN